MSIFIPLQEFQRQRDWQMSIKEGVVDVFRDYLAALHSNPVPSVEVLSADALLWVNETFFCRAAQNGLAATLVGEKVTRVIENFAVKQVRAAMLNYLSQDVSRIAQEVERVAITITAQDESACTSVEHATQEACRQIALVIASLRTKAGENAGPIYPADPFIFIHSAAPLNELIREQAEVRREWAGEHGLGDCWGRAHWALLKPTPKLSLTVGGKMYPPSEPINGADRTSEAGIQTYGQCSSLTSRLQMATPSEAAEEFILANPLVMRCYAGASGDASNKSWSPKSRQQFRSATRLATKYLGSKPLVMMTHVDTVAFYRMMLALPSDHHTHLVDEGSSLQGIIDRAARKAGHADFDRLTPQTARRHLSNIRNLCAWMSHYINLPVVTWADVISYRDDRVVGCNAILSVEDVEQIFKAPVWTGTSQYRGTPSKGPYVWHGAAYWVPLFLWYSGIARDVLCVSEVTDIELVDGIWCLRVRMKGRGLNENNGFDRAVPLHPELLRLGFLDYVEALNAEGEKLLFPDLQRASGQSAADVYSSRYWRNLRTCLGWLPNDSAEGAIREAAQKVLEDFEAPEEKVHDLFGLRGASEADVRYTRITPAPYLDPIVKMIPVVTGNLEARPINLVPTAARKSTPARIVPRVRQRAYQEERLGALVHRDAPRANPERDA